MTEVVKSTGVPNSSQGFPSEMHSVVHGAREPSLSTATLGAYVSKNAEELGHRPAVIVPWQSIRLSYQDLATRSELVAKSLISKGIEPGDCVGIMAGNCQEYIDVFLAGARIGCPIVAMNNNYSPAELTRALCLSHCKVLFMASKIGSISLTSHPKAVLELPVAQVRLSHIVYFGHGLETLKSKTIDISSYDCFLSHLGPFPSDISVLRTIENKVVSSQILTLQFTSGTTGLPKAASLTHMNIINNARLVGQAMRLTENDIVCCPPPLYHCFGTVIGFLACFLSGGCIVFPADDFNSAMTMDAIIRENVTTLLGVPTMFLAELKVMEEQGLVVNTVRTALAAGAPVLPSLIELLCERFNISEILIAYGMTETSPVTFITSSDDIKNGIKDTVGRVMPHTSAKVVNKEGTIVPRNQRGELCTSGYALQKGYWKDTEKTDEVMKVDADGARWMHTGDEALIDDQGYCRITGRIKDLIIRGGENITPQEIEERLIRHTAIDECCVVGITDVYYGQQVGCFVKQTPGSQRPSHEHIQRWVIEELGLIKAPRYIFWIGDDGIGRDFPKTGTGKYLKHILRDIGDKLVAGYYRESRL